MLQKRRPLASFFDHPVLPATVLEQYMKHGDRIVFVPSQPPNLTPKNLPKGKSFHEPGAKWKEDEWGYNKEIQDQNRARNSVIKRNREILEQYKARGTNPPPNSTVHVPGKAWLPSDSGYDEAKRQKMLAAKKMRMDKIAQLSKLVESHHKSAESVLKENKDQFSGPHDATMIEHYEFLKKSESLVLKTWNDIAKKYDTRGSDGKLNKDALKQQKKDLHAQLFVFTRPVRTKWEEIMSDVASFADSLGFRNFLGTTLPETHDEKSIFIAVYLALHKTAIRQILLLLTEEYKSARGITGEFASHSLKAQAVLSQIRAMKHPAGRRPSRFLYNKGPYLDSEHLNKWRREHSM